ncbi:serine protease inhibitor [Pseudarthrobacter psychrotolerans]|uniref:Serine protease inhibitor n=1 Tax=Pseudarthrobacter psychrotolerans TaxID=2697569 RepID=A0A6P1NQK0_9MICC|nr:SSI family serine proteinase inhibitor [Pseudarthrobacter psychrotolerans]QHK21458.1 serine protease inhibitor [Pseudarthrobacter psychrotolerans]
MRLLTLRPLLAVLALAGLAGLAACTPTPDGTGPSSASPTASSTASQGSSGSPAPDTETTVPAPSPSAPPAPSAGPGAGNAELAIMVKPSSTEPAVNYTLVCRDGLPTAESKHPKPEAACAALKNNAALLSPAPRSKDVACTQQYGGPQTATVTGIVDDTPVDVTFANTDGCEIAAWNAARDVLGASAGGT